MRSVHVALDPALARLDYTRRAPIGTAQAAGPAGGPLTGHLARQAARRDRAWTDHFLDQEARLPFSSRKILGGDHYAL